MPRGIPRRTGSPSTSSASSGMPGEQRRAAGDDHARGEQVLDPALLDLALDELEDLLHPRLDDLGQDVAREHARLRGRPRSAPRWSRPCSPCEASAQPCCCLIRSASCVGVRRPTAMSLVRWLPPSAAPRCGRSSRRRRWRCRWCRRRCRPGRRPAPSRPRRAPPATEASGCSTMSATFRPVRFAHLTMFCAEETAPVTMCDLGLEPHAAIPSGSLMPSWSSMMNSCGRTWMTSRSSGIATAFAASMTRATSASRTSLSFTATMPCELKRLDVAAGDARCRRRDLAAGHVLGLFDRALDRGDGGVDVDHHALAQPLRRVRADADDVDAVVGDLADDGADLGRADVEADDDVSASASP